MNDISICDYRMVKGITIEELQSEVNRLMQLDDWQPYGSPYHSGSFHVQALVIRRQEEEI